MPGWGLQLPVERVLTEMNEVGLTATELGAAGWLPTTATEINAVLGHYDLAAVAAFQPVVLHDADRLADTLKHADAAAQLLQDVGASNFVTCVVSDPDDWQRPELTDEQWACLYSGISELDIVCAAHGLTQVIHPHVDSLIEQADEVERVLANTAAQFCLDTGHLYIGGNDPVAFAEQHVDRIGLVHLKDVRSDIADRLRASEVTLMQAVVDGIFPSLGEGDVPLADVVRTVEASGYDGWYVFEQDAALLDGNPPPAAARSVTSARASRTSGP